MTFWSWVITFLYGIAIVLSLIYTKKIKGEQPRHLLWASISTFLLAMGINKQLDFQTLFIMSGKYLTGISGLASYNRLIQKTVALIVFLLLLTYIVIILIKTRKILNREKTALTGTIILLIFTFIRIGSISRIRVIMILQYFIYFIHGLEFLGLVFILNALTGHFRTAKKEQLSDRKAAPEI